VLSLEVSHPKIVPALRSVEGFLGNIDYQDHNLLHSLNSPPLLQSFIFKIIQSEFRYLISVNLLYDSLDHAVGT
jgi:hypothetical protein